MGSIYLIEWGTDSVYIGSTISFKRRKQEHIRYLLAGSHANTLLQREFNRHGINSFVFTVLQDKVDKGNLIHREKFWIDKMSRTKKLVNIANIRIDCDGVRHSVSRRKRMMRIAAANKNRWG